MPFPIAQAGLTLASLLGGLLGKNKGIDMKEWERMFGPAAVAGRTNEFMKMFSNSPFAAQQQLQAANTGQQVANNFAAMPGASQSGVGQIGQALSTGATNSLQSQLMAALFQMAQQAAQQNMGDKQNIFLHNQQQPTFLQQLGQSVSGAAGQALSMFPTKDAGFSKYDSQPSGAFTPQVTNAGGTSTYQNTTSPLDLSRFDIFANRAVGSGR